MEWRGIREAGILLELAEIAVFDLLHEAFAPEEVASRRDMSWLGTRRIDCGSFPKKRWVHGRELVCVPPKHEAFQRMKRVRTADTVAKAALRERKIRAKCPRKTARPRMKSAVSGTKTPLP
jgi:hypothetical protein